MNPNKLKSQKKGQRVSDQNGRDKSDILSVPGVSQAEDYLERGFHCKECQLELTSIEKELYGAYCVFCALGDSKPYPLWKTLKKAYLDWKIYILLRKFKAKYKDKSFFNMVAVLGSIGIQHIGAAYNIKLKQELIKELREAIDGKREVQNLRASSEHNRGEEERGQESQGETEGYAHIGPKSSGHAEVSRLRDQLAGGKEA